MALSLRTSIVFVFYNLPVSPNPHSARLQSSKQTISKFCKGNIVTWKDHFRKLEISSVCGWFDVWWPYRRFQIDEPVFWHGSRHKGSSFTRGRTSQRGHSWKPVDATTAHKNYSSTSRCGLLEWVVSHRPLLRLLDLFRRKWEILGLSRRKVKGRRKKATRSFKMAPRIQLVQMFPSTLEVFYLFRRLPIIAKCGIKF